MQIKITSKQLARTFKLFFGFNLAIKMLQKGGHASSYPALRRHSRSQLQLENEVGVVPGCGEAALALLGAVHGAVVELISTVRSARGSSGGHHHGHQEDRREVRAVNLKADEAKFGWHWRTHSTAFSQAGNAVKEWARVFICTLASASSSSPLSSAHLAPSNCNP